MELRGQITTKCPPEFMVAIMRNPTALAQLLPAGSRIEAIAEDSYSFKVSKDVGPITLTLPGKLQLRAKGGGHDQTLTVHAAHLIGGKVDMELNVAIVNDGGMTRLTYEGDLTASGLAGRVLQEHRARANHSLKAALMRLKLHAEKQFDRAAPI
ncbi:MAG: SRPBCC domain-containing protein [Alphaproteobacteria bacterium]